MPLFSRTRTLLCMVLGAVLYWSKMASLVFHNLQLQAVDFLSNPVGNTPKDLKRATIEFGTLLPPKEFPSFCGWQRRKRDFPYP